MKTIHKSLLSLLLAFAIVLQIIPATVFATEDDNDTRSLDELMLTDEASLVPEEPVCDEILFEDTSLREENVKHFRMKDGTYRAVVYDTPVHYLDDEGNWQEYDNTLHTIDRSGEATGYRVENGDSVRLFAADADSEALLSVSKGEYALTISPVLTPDAERPVEPELPVEIMDGTGETTDAAAVQQPETAGTGITVDPKDEPLVSAEVLTIAAPAEEEITDTFFAQAQPEKLYSALEYENLLDGATLRYENYANSVKESIIIPARQDDYTYSFCLQVTGLTPELLDDGSISLTNADGETIYTIPAPYMIDAKDETSHEAFYTLEEADSGWLLTVTADADWMNDTNRAYPVLLDPTVTEATNINDFSSGYTRSGDIYANCNEDTGLYVGNDGTNHGAIRSYIHINRLPKLPTGSEVTGASFSLWQYSFTGSSLDIGLYGLTKTGNIDGRNPASDWESWAKALTWSSAANGQADYHGYLSDQVTTSSANNRKYLHFNITTLAFAWYDSEHAVNKCHVDGCSGGTCDNDKCDVYGYQKNYGFLLKSLNESAISRATFYSSKKTENRPYVVVEYRSARGIEPDFTYQTAAIGRAGTAYVGDFDMQTTLVVPLVSDPSDTMPLSVSLVYNSDMAERYFTSADIPNTRNFENMKVGRGWKLSLQETVVRLSSGQLVYTDGDGTEHYYIYSADDGGYIEADNNTRLKITSSGTQYTLSDEYGNEKIFTNGYLTEVRDAYGNALYYCYNDTEYSSGSSAWKPSSASNSHYISYVFRQNKNCAAEKILVLGYSGNFLSTIIPKCNYESDNSKSTRRITLVRDTVTIDRTTHTNLIEIQYPADEGTLQSSNKRKAQYTYFGGEKFWYRNKLRTTYDLEANYGIEFNYSYSGKTRNINEYVLNGSDRLYGTMMHGYKRSHLLAVYRDYGKDQDEGTGDDYLTFKVLNRVGRTISAYTTDNSEQRILGSSAVSYTSDADHRKANNLLAATAYMGQPGVNLLRNGDGENIGSYWSSVTTSTAAHRSGAYAFVLNAQTPSFYQLADLAGEETYTFSGYIHLNNALTSGGVYLALLDSNTETELARSQMVTATSSEIDGGWQRLTVTYKPSSRVVVKASVISTGLGSNTAYADCLQLEQENAASTYNLIETGSFDQLSSVPSVGGNIFGWYYSGNVAFESGGLFGSKVAKIEGRSGSQRISQNITLNAPAGSTFLLSGWGKANALPSSVPALTPETKDYPYYGLVARLYYDDGASEPFYFSFDPYSSDWQERSGILMPSEANQNKQIISVTVVTAYDNNANTAYFDNVSLRMEPAQTYRYDENGNPIAATQEGTGSENATYAANGIDLTGYTAANGSKYTYTYNSSHDVTLAEIGTLNTATTYNDAGNVTRSKLYDDANTMYMESTAVATPDKNHTQTITDANGDTTNYTYYGDTGLLKTIENAKQQITEYAYNTATLRPTSTYRNGIACINYGYTDGRLTSLDRKTFREGSEQHQYYSFAYNDWGQPTTTKVGNFTLSTNTYYNYKGDSAGTGGNLQATTYGNNQSITYTYDNLDRLIEKRYTEGKYITYTYNAEGQLAKMTYGDNDGVIANYLFEYDSLGRLIRSSETNKNDAVQQQTEHIYDNYNRLLKQNWALGSKGYSESYTYNDGTNEDGSLKTMTVGTGDTLSYTYDPLHRLSKVTVKSGNTSLFSTAYAYASLSGTQTTPQVAFRNVRLESNNTILEGKKYVYDELGNITEIRQSTSPYNVLVAYEYDSQNQLTKETYYDGNGIGTGHITDYYHYTYDTAGNLLTAGKNGTIVQTYSYGNTNWHDLLTAVNGKPIAYEGQTYDSERNIVEGTALSGNPVYYDGWNFDWQNGRELVKAEQTNGTTDTTLSYTYGADGIRTSKTYTVKTYEVQRTVTFVADGRTVKTMTVNDGYVLQNSDYPTVPAKEGYNGSWQKYTDAIREDITITASYSLKTYFVLFTADDVVVSRLRVTHGTVLTDSDYPAVPAKEDYIGSWEKYTQPIYSGIVIKAVYVAAHHTVTFRADLRTVKTMTVDDGYVLKNSDYPTVPSKNGYVGNWNKYTAEIHSDITITATYKSGIKDPVLPTDPWEVMSENLPEPIEPQDVEEIPTEPDDITNAVQNATANDANIATDGVELLASRPGQTLVSTQTVTHEYLTLNGKVARETVKTNDNVTDILDFIYDEAGRPFALNISTNGGSAFTTYYYILNLQGDVVKLVTSSGSAVAIYEYDAWGNILSESGSMADKNPLRYRGYYYDNETGFYYLQSRYYDPTVRRFVNADAYTSTGQGFVGTNMFAYCGNNPVVIADHSGNAGEEAMGWWGAGMWWLCVIDGALPIGDAVYVLGLGICCVIAGVEKSNSVISKSRIETNEISEAEMDASAATGSLEDIASRYGLYECREAALAMARRDKKRGYLIKLEFSETPGFVIAPLSKYGTKTAISLNGCHWGYCDQNHIVRCNVFPMGLPEEEWILAFEDASGSYPAVYRIPLP